MMDLHGEENGMLRASVTKPLLSMNIHIITFKYWNAKDSMESYSYLSGASAIFVGVYEPTKQKLLKSLPENLSALAHLVVKQRMQTGQFASAPDAVRLIISKEGFRGLYAGYGSFLLRDLPFDAMQFCIYEQLRLGYKLAVSFHLHLRSLLDLFSSLGRLRSWFSRRNSKHINLDFHRYGAFFLQAKRDLNDSENAMIGAFAGAVTGAITTPLDVIKTRLMVQGSARQYQGVLHCVGTIAREEGTSALFKGMGPRVLWIGIGGSIFFGVLEKTKQLLAQKRPVDQ
nr:S-adenosylmethionine carrier 1, chloroplastic/mitochondrial-like isoform X2 [Ipomoea trifida]